MTNIDPAARLTSTYPIDDLRALVDGDGPFASILLPAGSEHFGSDHRLDIRWRNARRMIESTWPQERLDELDQRIGELDHGEAEGFVIIQRHDGVIHVESMTSGLQEAIAAVDDAPRLLELIEHRQRTLPHIIVDADRAGATILAFDAGRAVTTEDVEGDSLHMHRSRGGGWSHRRFQQRAENTWERNAGEVAEVTVSMAREHQPVVIAIAGEVRATQMLHDALDDEFGDLVVDLESGDTDGIAEEIVRVLDDLHARLQVAVLERLRDEQGITDPDEVLAALHEGRVETLLVAGPSSRADDDQRRAQLTTIGIAIVAALRTSALIVVMPSTPEMNGGLAALVRW